MIAITLARREWIRFYRQRSRIIGSLATPLVFWIFLGSGLSAAFPQVSEQVSFLKYFFPGNLILSLLFTSIFASISIIEDRREGFLQGVLVSPASPFGIVFGKVLGGSLIAVVQATFLLLLAPLAGFHLGLAQWLWIGLGLWVISIGLSSLGFFFAWWFDSVQGFHSIMNTVLFPMWLLSGAFFSVEKAPIWLKPVMWANPLTPGFRFIESTLNATPAFPNLLFSFVFTAVLLLAAVAVVKVRRKEAP